MALAPAAGPSQWLTAPLVPRDDTWYLGAEEDPPVADVTGHGAQRARDQWTLDRPTRQGTGDSVGSTAASEGDIFASPRMGFAFGAGTPPKLKGSPRLTVGKGSPRLSTRWSLDALPERRGWKHFLQHTLKVPIAFAAGVLLGGMSLPLLETGAAAMTALGGRGLEPYPAVPPPHEVPNEYLRSPEFNNACLLQNLQLPEGPQSFDACGFVINSTDEVWNRRGGDVDAAIDRYFHEGYLNAGSWGRRGVGKAALRAAIFSEMRGFPDIRIHITDCQCAGNDVDGYKCSMPDILEGTNTGPSAYGPATGRYARWTGMVQSFVKRDPVSGQWQYFAEWGVHDEWALIQQLGLDFARVPHPPTNSEPFHDCTPLLRLSPPALDGEDARVDPSLARAATTN